MAKKVLNLVFLCIYSFTFLYGFAKNINIPLVVGSWLLWFVTTILISPSWFMKTWKALVYIGLLVLIELGYCQATAQSFSSSFIQMVLSLLWFFMFFFYKDNLRLLKWPFVFLLVIFVIDCYDTIIGNIMIPGASRLSGEDSDAFSIRYSAHIGSYPFLYSLTLLSFPIALFFKYKVLNRLVAIVLLALFVVTLLYGGYLISLLLWIAIVLIALIKVKSNNHFFVAISLALIALGLFLLRNQLLGLLYNLATFTNSEAIMAHVQDILSGGDVDSSSGGRAVLYLGAIKNFLASPLIGAISGKPLQFASNHSEFLGYLERYGLLSVVHFSFFVYVLRIVRKRIVSTEVRGYYRFYEVCLIVLLLLNPINNIQPFTCMMYFTIPLAFLYLDNYLLVMNNNN